MDLKSFVNASSDPTFADPLKKIDIFIKDQIDKNRKIAFITSGGTSVPLENRAVRFIDNFSVGTRGSTSAEYFLKQGYAVIFLHRRGSLQPFNRHFQHANFLSLFTENEDNQGGIQLKEEWKSLATSCYRSYEENKDRFLMIGFTTLIEYLNFLKLICEVLHKMGAQVLIYLAAAVSDFYVPELDMAPHKIQSSDGPLNLHLQIVPKFLQPLVCQQVPDAFVVSFKLETDESILLKKCKKALDVYKHQLVIGNILERRKKEVVMVREQSENWILLKDSKSEETRKEKLEQTSDTDTKEYVRTVEEFEGINEIEDVIITRLIKLHKEHIDQKKS